MRELSAKEWNSIYKKLKKYMEQNGVREMDPEDRDFDADRHEAISAVAGS